MTSATDDPRKADLGPGRPRERIIQHARTCKDCLRSSGASCAEQHSIIQEQRARQSPSMWVRHDSATQLLARVSPFCGSTARRHRNARATVTRTSLDRRVHQMPAFSTRVNIPELINPPHPSLPTVRRHGRYDPCLGTRRRSPNATPCRSWKTACASVPGFIAAQSPQVALNFRRPRLKILTSHRLSPSPYLGKIPTHHPCTRSSSVLLSVRTEIRTANAVPEKHAPTG